MLYFSMYIPVLCFDLLLGIVLDRVPLEYSVLVIGFSSLFAQVVTLILFVYCPPGYKIGLYLTRALFGLAGSTGFTVQGLLITQYAAEYYDVLIGAGLCVPFVADSLNLVLTPYIIEQSGSATVPWAVASTVDAIGACIAIIISILLVRTKKLKIDSLEHKLLIEENVSSSLQLQKKHNQLQKSIIEQNNTQQHPLQHKIIQKIEQSYFSLKYMKQLPKLFWLIVLNVAFSQLTIGGIFSNLNDLLNKRFGISYLTAGSLSTIPYLLAAFFSVLFGWVISKSPAWRKRFILFVPCLMTVSLIWLYFLPNNPDSVNGLHYSAIVMLMISIGAGFAVLYAVLGSSVGLLVTEDRVGMAWGVIGTAIALGEVLGPLLDGFILDSDPDLCVAYTTLTLVYIGLSLAGVLVGAYIFWGGHQGISSAFKFIQNQNHISQANTISPNHAENILPQQDIIEKENQQSLIEKD